MDNLFLQIPRTQLRLPSIDSYYETKHYVQDSEENYIANKNKFGTSWRYYDLNLSYKFNRNYFRMDHQVEETNFDNYLIFFGCSYTFGTGLPINDTFPYLSSKTLNKDYINCGICGSGVDFVFFNAVNFLTTVDKIPRLLVVNWPPKERTFFWVNNEPVFYGPRFGPFHTTYWNSTYKNFMLADDHLMSRFEYYRKNLRKLCSKLGVNYLEFTWADQIDGLQKIFVNPIESMTTENVNLYYARDVKEPHFGSPANRFGHPGILQHIKTSEEIVKFFTANII